MALQSSGPISLSQVNVELTYSPTAIITMNDPAVRILFAKSSGAISLGDGYGKARHIPYSTVETFTAAGLQSFTIPAGITSIKVKLTGGGGGGAASSGAGGGYGNYYGGGGGGGGATLSATIAVTPGEVMSFTVGAGGLGYPSYGTPFGDRSSGRAGDAGKATTGFGLTAGGGGGGSSSWDGYSGTGIAAGGAGALPGGGNGVSTASGGLKPQSAGGTSINAPYGVGGKGSIPSNAYNVGGSTGFAGNAGVVIINW